MTRSTEHSIVVLYSVWRTLTYHALLHYLQCVHVVSYLTATVSCRNL